MAAERAQETKHAPSHVAQKASKKAFDHDGKVFIDEKVVPE